MNDKELGKRTMEEHWEVIGARARALLAAERVGLPSREDAAEAFYKVMLPTGDFSHSKERNTETYLDAVSCADLALSWHAPEPMEQDVERLAIWLGFVFNENSGNEGTGWDSEYEDDRNGHRAQARALIARYGTPPDAALAPSPAEALPGDDIPSENAEVRWWINGQQPIGWELVQCGPVASAYHKRRAGGGL